jgi:hypothetical protein
MREIMRMIKNAGMEFLHGRMAMYIKAITSRM